MRYLMCDVIKDDGIIIESLLKDKDGDIRNFSIFKGWFLIGIHSLQRRNDEIRGADVIFMMQYKPVHKNMHIHEP